MDNYEFYHLEFTIPENFRECRGFFRDCQSVHCVILFILTARLYRIYIMSKLMKTAEEFLSIHFRESDYGVLAVVLFTALYQYIHVRTLLYVHVCTDIAQYITKNLHSSSQVLTTDGEEDQLRGHRSRSP